MNRGFSRFTHIALAYSATPTSVAYHARACTEYYLYIKSVTSFPTEPTRVPPQKLPVVSPSQLSQSVKETQPDYLPTYLPT